MRSSHLQEGQDPVFFLIWFSPDVIFFDLKNLPVNRWIFRFSNFYFRFLENVGKCTKIMQITKNVASGCQKNTGKNYGAINTDAGSVLLFCFFPSENFRRASRAQKPPRNSIELLSFLEFSGFFQNYLFYFLKKSPKI